MTSGPVDNAASVEALLLENGWASQAQIDRVKPLVTGPRQLLRALADQNIVSIEHLALIDTIQALQAQVDGFTILRKLGAGGMGTVYLAAQEDSGERVALKVIHPRLAGDAEFLSRFHRETKALIGLRHPHLANVIGSGNRGATHWLALEYVQGPNLASLLREMRALPESYVLGVVRQVAECLAYVYDTAGLVHRDVKPENVLIARTTPPSPAEPLPADDVAKLIDFGLVKAANDEEHLTQTGMTIGTPLYMSPEQVRGDKLDCRSDIYGLGATMYHLLTGSPPFRGTSPGAIMSAHLTDAVPDPGAMVPSLTQGTRRLAMTAMAKDVGQRYLSFAAMIKDLDEAIEELRERAGSSIRLLRKPLVMARKPTGGKRPGGTDRVEKPGEGSAATREPVVVSPTPLTQSSPAAPASIEERIRSKHVERQERKHESGPHARKGAAGSGERPVPAPPAPGSASASRGSVAGALVKVSTDKVRAAARPPPLPNPTTPPARSAAFDEDAATPAAGAGVMPWVILAGAVLGALGLLAYRLWM